MPTVRRSWLRSLLGVTSVALLVCLLRPAALHADEIRVMTSGAFTAAFLELKPRFEAATGHTLVTVTTTMGAGATSIPSRLSRGEAADVVIVDDAALVEMIDAGLVAPDSRVELVRSLIGIAVKQGKPKPDISSVAALARALLDARSIAVSASVSGTYLTTDLFPRLGIAAQLASKTARIEGERVGSVVARGDADIGFQQMSELLPIAGIDIVGPLPPAVQKVSVFSAGVVRTSPRTAAARSLIAYFIAPANAAAITATGLEPIVRR